MRIQNKMVLAFCLLLFLVSCKKYAIAKPQFGKSAGATLEDGARGSENGVGGIGEGIGNGPPEEDSVKPTSLVLLIDADPNNDAVTNTFAVATTKLKGNLATYEIVQKRALLSTLSLDDSQKMAFQRMCNDMGLSSKADSFLAATTWDQETPLFLMWRSHYSQDLKLMMVAAAVKGQGPVRCAIDLELTSDEETIQARITFDPIASKDSRPAGALDIKKASSLGLLLPNASFEKDNALTSKLKSEALTSDVRITLGVKAIAVENIKASVTAAGLTEQCYTSFSGGNSHVANPDGKNNFKIDFTLDNSNLLTIQSTNVAGRLLDQCKNLKFQQTDAGASYEMTCAQYQAIKDSGVEAGCAWAFALVNKNDAEDNIAFNVAMNKISYKTVDSSKIAEISVLLPRSDRNPLRAGAVQMVNFNKVQQDMLTDAFDIWLHFLPNTFDRDFGTRIKKISYAPQEDMCLKGFGAFARFGANEFFWCPGGSLDDKAQGSRSSDPGMILYRALTLYHETRHTMNWAHDHDNKSYAPCGGTAASVELYFELYTACSTDFCRVLRDDIIRHTKSELNYDYANDTTNRKSQGVCKEWTKALGIQGEGF